MLKFNKRIKIGAVLFIFGLALLYFITSFFYIIPMCTFGIPTEPVEPEHLIFGMSLIEIGIVVGIITGIISAISGLITAISGLISAVKSKNNK